MNAQVTRDPSDVEVDEAVRVLRLLSDPTRLRLVWALLHGEHSVNELAEHLGVQPASVSQHLAKLRMARLVRTRRQGTRIYYMAQDEHLEELVAEAVFHADHRVGEAEPLHGGRTRRRGLGA